MLRKKSKNIFSISEEISKNYFQPYAFGWEYGRDHALPLWFEFVHISNWKCDMEYIHQNPINTAFEIPMEGNMAITLDDVCYVVDTNELFILPRGITNILKVGPSGYCRKLSFGISGSLLAQLLSSMHLDGGTPLRLKDIPAIFRLIERGRAMIVDKNEKDVPALAALALELIMEISRQCSVNVSPLLANAMYIMDFNLSRKIKLGDIAKELNVSDRKLSNAFNEELNISPMRYFADLRMKKAEALLNNSNFTVNEISAQTGYSSASVFIREFHKKHSTSPSVFRRKSVKIPASCAAQG